MYNIVWFFALGYVEVKCIKKFRGYLNKRKEESNKKKAMIEAKMKSMTEEEKRRLSNFPVGQGLFFAGPNHVHIQVIASETEESLITTNPNAK